MPSMYKNTACALLPLLFSTVVFAETPIQQCERLFAAAEYEAAIVPCTEAARMGDPVSQTYLGEVYDYGPETVQDAKKTAHWWRMAANSDYLPAQNLLALKSYYGGTVMGPEPGWKQDYKEAMRWWRISAEKGVPTSQFMLGDMYRHGQGVQSDLVEAYAWFKLASRSGYKLATDIIVETSRKMTPQQKKSGLDLYKKYRNQYVNDAGDI
ncbi:hypothetical protein DJ031_14125 [bacterium endosymbiont of Escarpia laminata]|nr:MAG: hypothetical protein DJ031_14125 [bacterium endosymbiont of Escarpia laminata]